MSRRSVLRAGTTALSAAAAVNAQSSGQKAPALKSAGRRAIDIHAHFFPQTYLDVIAQGGARFDTSYKIANGRFSIHSPLSSNAAPLSVVDVKARIAEMDRQGVTMQAISLTGPMAYMGDTDFNHRLARAWNDGASAAHQAYPDRLVAFLTLPMPDPQSALDELNRAYQLPGMRGVGMGTNILGRDLDDPMFEPVFARIESLGLPVVLHPLSTLPSKRLAPFYLGNLLGNPYDTGIAACHLIFGGVLDRHPRLDVSLPHSGGTLPILIGRIDRGWKVRPETKHLQQAPSTYLTRFTYDTICHSAKILKFLISEVGAERVMLGSDYCYDMGYQQPVQFLDQAGLSAAERTLILGGNAAKMLKL
jgi:aminocarboxymuconate-semialdehyde decarboxylase